MGKHVQTRRRRMARTVLPVAATAALTGALAASPLGMAADADPGPGDGGGGHHHGGGDWGDDHDGWDGGDHDRWDGDHRDGDRDDGGGWGGGWADGDGPAQAPAPAPAPVSAPVSAAPAGAPAPAEPAAPVVQVKAFPYSAPVVQTDLTGLTLEKAGSGDLVKASTLPTSDGTVGAIVGTGVALASIGGFAAVLAAGRARRDAAA